ncbi:MAG: cobalt-factor II C(20)-methyltransferase [Halobacteriota archaeon]
MTLYGVGLGPGDPKLVTVRGKEIMERAERVYAPGDLAERIAGEFVPDARIEQLSFPMTRDESALRAAWEDAAEAVAPAAETETVAFVTIGDPKIYSTFSHLERAMADYPAVDVETVPGVSVLSAFTAAMDVTIDGGAIDVREARAGVPTDGPDQCLLLKVTDVTATHQQLTAAGYDVTYGRRLFMNDATVTTDPTSLDDDYFTVAFAKRGRSA